MESDREEKLLEVRRVLETSLRPSLLASSAVSADVLSPGSPHTPVTCLEKRLKSVQARSIKQKYREAAQRKRFPPIRELRFEEEEALCDISDSLLSSPQLSAASSVAMGDLDDSRSEPRYYTDFIEKGVIASGDYGEVYHCQHRLDKQHYAIKRIRLLISTKKAWEQSVHEAVALASSSFFCDSQHILKYRNMWVEREHLFIAMELCDCSLRTFVERNGRLSTEQITNVLRDICKGLRELHSMNTVHLDIKPENILYSFSHIFKLGDLGLARMLSSLRAGAEVPEGDSRYLAPELLSISPDKRDSLPDLTKSDIFSLGATIYEVIIGSELHSHGPLWQEIRQGKLSFPSGTDAKLAEIIGRMMASDPAARPSACELLSSAFLSRSKREIKRLRSIVEQLETQGATVKKRRMSL